MISQIYLISFLVGVVYAVIAGIMAGISGDGESGGHEANGHDFNAEHDGHELDLHPDGMPEHDTELEAEHDFSHEHDNGFSALDLDSDSGISLTPVSPVTIATFVTSFGGTGLIATEVLHFPAILSIPTALILGIGIAGLVLYGFNKIFKATQASSEARVTSLVGIDAEVITPIPAEGIGEIAYISRGSRFTGPARALNKHSICKNANVVITKIIGSTFYVRETVDEELRNI